MIPHCLHFKICRIWNHLGIQTTSDPLRMMLWLVLTVAAKTNHSIIFISLFIIHYYIFRLRHRSGHVLWWITGLCRCTFRSWWEVWKKKPAQHRNWVHRIKTIIQAESHLMPVYESWLFMLAEQWGFTSRLYIILLMHHWECKDRATQLQLCSSAPHKRGFVR